MANRICTYLCHGGGEEEANFLRSWMTFMTLYLLITKKRMILMQAVSIEHSGDKVDKVKGLKFKILPIYLKVSYYYMQSSKTKTE